MFEFFSDMDFTSISFVASPGFALEDSVCSPFPDDTIVLPSSSTPFAKILADTF